MIKAFGRSNMKIFWKYEYIARVECRKRVVSFFICNYYVNTSPDDINSHSIAAESVSNARVYLLAKEMMEKR